MSISDMAARRIHAQLLARRALGMTVPKVVRTVCGIQAQEPAAAALAVRARSADLLISDVNAALIEERSIVRTWAMRGTLHLIAADDVAWMTALLGPVFIAKGRRRRAELGLSDDICERGAGVICDATKRHGPRSREELSTHLDDAGIPMQGQAVYHLLQYAALKGGICVVPSVGDRPAYALVDDWLSGASHSFPEDPAAELALRYLSAFGPATPGDFAAWSGLPRPAARKAWKTLGGKLDERPSGEGNVWKLKSAAADVSDAEAQLVRLLPGYDNLLLGYERREWVLAPEHARRIHPGGGVIRPSLLVDGRIAGRWVLERLGDQIAIRVDRFEEMADPVMERLRAEVNEIGRFLGEDVRLAACD